MSRLNLARLRLLRHGVDRSPFKSAAEAVYRLGAVQAQDCVGAP